MKDNLNKVAELIDLYQKTREETNTPFMFYEREDILRAVELNCGGKTHD